MMPRRVPVLYLALSILPSIAAAQGVQLNVVQESIELGPSDFLSAEALLENGRWVVAIRLAPDAASRFGSITERNIRKKMQIVVDDRIVSAPIIMSPIRQGLVHISGDFTSESAAALAKKIKP
jgi:preprotein translocase subunit SecD